MELMSTRDIIIKLKAARKEKALSLNKLLFLLDSKGKYISMTSLDRVFAEGSEENCFSYEGTLRPIASVLLEETKVIDTDERAESVVSLLRQGTEIDRIRQSLMDLEERITAH